MTQLDKFAQSVAQARATGQFAHLEAQESAYIEFLLDLAPDTDQQAVGAAWLILGQLIATGLTQHPQHEQLQAVGNLLNAARLAGQRLYAGAPLTHPCPIPRGNGTACRFTAKGARQETVDAMMRAHVDVYHPAATWPPEPVPTHEFDGLVASLDGAYVGSTPAPPLPIEGAEETAYCACGRPAELVVGTVNKPDGQPGDVKALCFFCHRNAEEWIQRSAGRPGTAEQPTPQSVREGRHTINELRVHHGLAEVFPPDGEPMPEGLLDALIQATWAEAEEAATLAPESIGRCRTCQTPVSVTGPPIAAKGYVDQDGLKCAEHVQVEDIDLDAEPLARSYTLDEAMAHPGGIDALTSGAVQHLGFSVEGDDEQDEDGE